MLFVFLCVPCVLSASPSCGADPGSLARHSASGVSLSVIGQGTFAAATGETAYHQDTKEHGGTRGVLGSVLNSKTLCLLVFLVLLGVLVVFVVVPPATARRSPRWGRMGRCLSGEPLEIRSANGVGGRSSFERSPSSKSVSPGRRPSAVWGQTTRPSATRCRPKRRDPRAPQADDPYYHTSRPKCQGKSGGDSIIAHASVILFTAKESTAPFYLYPSNSTKLG